MKYGFEKEYFVADTSGNFCLVPDSIPRDDCGYLAEARGEPHSDPVSAAALLLAKEYELRMLVEEMKLTLVALPWQKLPDTLIRQALCQYGKNPAPKGLYNLYGNEYKDRRCRAGLHVHFSNEALIEKTVTHGDYKENVKFSYKKFINISEIVRQLDVRFKDEIRNTKRVVGFYELKPYGFEYRSLPNNIDPMKVAMFIKELKHLED